MAGMGRECWAVEGMGASFSRNERQKAIPMTHSGAYSAESRVHGSGPIEILESTGS